jgi:O-antigen/teichoic acid export membrane protein
VFGTAYAGIWLPYAILVPAAACVCVMEVLRHFLLTRLERKREFVLLANGLLLLNGVLAVAGAAAFGLVGAAASTTVSYIVVALAMAAFCARSLDVSVRELLLPRPSDLSSYWRFSRTALAAARRR